MTAPTIDTAPVDLVSAAENLQEIYTAQDTVVASDVQALFTRYDTHPNFPALLGQAMPVVLGQHAHAAGLITAHWYDQLDPASSFRATPITSLPTDQIAKTVHWALNAPGDQPPVDRLVDASQRMVRNIGRDTVITNAEREGVRYARYASATACAFCRVLATRRAVYRSARSAGEGHKYHRHCRCIAVRVPAGQWYQPPSYVEDWRRQYYNATEALVRRGEPVTIDTVSAELRRTTKPVKFPALQRELATQKEVIAEKFATERERFLKVTRPQLISQLNNARKVNDIIAVAYKLQPTVSFGPGQWSNVNELREAVRALDDTLVKYPNLKVKYFDSNDDLSGIYGRTWGFGHLTTEEPGITLNNHWLAQPDRSWKNSFDENVAEAFHYRGGESPGYAVTMHEMGHVMQDYAEQRGVDIQTVADRALSDYYFDTYGTRYTPEPAKMFRGWKEANLSGYSYTNTGEMLAEAFADVEINGDKAHESSKVLHSILVDAYNGDEYRSIPKRDWAIAKAPSWSAGALPMNYHDLAWRQAHTLPYTLEALAAMGKS